MGRAALVNIAQDVLVGRAALVNIAQVPGGNHFVLAALDNTA